MAIKDTGMYARVFFICAHLFPKHNSALSLLSCTSRFNVCD